MAFNHWRVIVERDGAEITYDTFLPCETEADVREFYAPATVVALERNLPPGRHLSRPANAPAPSPDK